MTVESIVLRKAELIRAPISAKTILLNELLELEMKLEYSAEKEWIWVSSLPQKG